MFGYWSMAAFLAVFAIASLRWSLPAWLSGVYGLMSLICFMLHALDKQAAIRGARRIPEKTLLGTALLGGWPGGVLAQQLFRHKTAKPSFQWAFRLGIMLNLGLFLLLWTPLGRALKWSWS